MGRLKVFSYQQDCDTFFRAKDASGIRVRKFGQGGGEILRGRVETRPPIAVKIEDDGSGAQDLAHTRGVFAGDGENHVQQFGELKRLADDWAHAEIFGFLFGVFHCDLNGKGHDQRIAEFVIS